MRNWLFALSVLPLSLGLGCHSEPRAASDTAIQAAQAEPTKPFAFMSRMPANSFDASNLNRRGILVAVWPDGKIVRAESEEKIGQSYVMGSLTQDQLEDLRQQIDHRDVLSLESHVVPCGGGESLCVRTSKGVESVAFGGQQPGSFKTVKRFLLDLKITDPVAVPADQYRTYPHDWYK